MADEIRKPVLLIGGSGFVGSAVGRRLAQQGWPLRLLTRRIRPNQLSFPCQPFLWDGETIPSAAIAGAGAVINLAGQGIADRGWSARYRKQILESRVLATRALHLAIAGLADKPAVVIQASAVGYYGTRDRGEAYDEDAAAGDDFLGEVGRAWEQEAAGIGEHTRLCTARLGLVLGWEGGALPKLWDIYASGMGSILGSGRQWMNWVHLDDVVAFLEAALTDEGFAGPYNLVAPGNVSNCDFHRLLAEPTPSLKSLAAPGLCIRAVLGGRADLVLRGPRVVPRRLTEAGFSFAFADAGAALRELLTERAEPRSHYLKAQQWLPLRREEVWAFFATPGNLEKITPTWLGFRIKGHSGAGMGAGTRIDYALKLHGLPLSWRSHISRWKPQEEFIDEQERGPYARWHHRHTFRDFADGTLIEDRVEFRLPLFPLGQIALPLVRRDLESIFRHRAAATARQLIPGGDGAQGGTQ